MADSTCPICGCERFYVKDPEDEFECYEFECRQGEICFAPEVDPHAAPAIEAQTETFCNKCSWHDAFERLIKEEDAK